MKRRWTRLDLGQVRGRGLLVDADQLAFPQLPERAERSTSKGLDGNVEVAARNTGLTARK